MPAAWSHWLAMGGYAAYVWPAYGLSVLIIGGLAVASILSRVGDKWTVLIVMTLASGPVRFNTLKRTIGGVSQRMLTLSLRGLERDGMVTRTVFPTIPPRVDYELTPLGHSLRIPIQALGDWAFAHIPVVENARAEFDARRVDALN